MRLPQSILHSQFFIFSDLSELLRSSSETLAAKELAEVENLSNLGYPPITSRHTLALMLGVSVGLIRSIETRPSKHYRTFTIPKGKSTRRIDAPRVALKIIQKWISIHLEKNYKPLDHVYGFVSGRSHIEAAKAHCECNWVFSVDIKDFFQTTPQTLVSEKLKQAGFPQGGADLIASLCCYRGNLAQGSPSSPVLSNICFEQIDSELLSIATKYNTTLTRYADDIVFSGLNDFPENLKVEVEALFLSEPWDLSTNKTSLSIQPNRLKVHGILVHGEKIRLTKGYRNRLRAYRHLFDHMLIKKIDISMVTGHLNYGDYVDKVAESK